MLDVPPIFVDSRYGPNGGMLRTLRNAKVKVLAFDFSCIRHLAETWLQLMDGCIPLDVTALLLGFGVTDTEYSLAMETAILELVCPFVSAYIRVHRD